MELHYEMLYAAVKLLPANEVWTPEARRAWLDMVEVVLDYLVEVQEPANATAVRVVHFSEGPGLSACRSYGPNEGLSVVTGNVTCGRCLALITEETGP